MSFEEKIKQMLDAFSQNIEKENEGKNEEIYQKLKELYEQEPKSFLKRVRFANNDLSNVFERIVGVKNGNDRFIVKHIFSGLYKHFHRKRIEKLEGMSCSNDKASFIEGKTIEAIRKGENISLFDDYKEIDQIKENKEVQAYWSPKTIKDTEEAIKLFSEWYMMRDEDVYLNALRQIDNHIRATPEPVDYIVEELKNALPEYKNF